MTRDYAAEMRALIDAETKGTYQSRVVASHIVEKLRATDAELLSGWLDSHAEQLLWKAINERDNSRRAHIRGSSSRAKFAEAAEAHDKGDTAAMPRWLSTPFTVAGNDRKSLGDMTREEVLFASDAYERRENDNAMTKFLLRAIAKKRFRGPVRAHYTDEQIDNMWQSIARPAA